MKHLLYLFILLTVSFFVKAQQPQIKADWLASTPVYYNGGSMIVNDIAIGDDGSVVAVGNFYNTVDFDPGPDTFNVTASGYSDIFIAKYSKAGQLIYAYHFGSNHLSSGTAYGVTLDDAGNAYMTGNFNNTIDFNPGAGSAVLTGKSTEAFIASYDKNGAFRYAIQVTNTQDDIVRTQVARSIAIDKQRNVYVTGSFRHTVDFDPGAGKHYLNSVGERNIFFAKYDSSGRYLFAKNIAGSGEDEASKVVLDKKGNIVLCGYFTSAYADFDPSDNDSAILKAKGNEDIFFAKYDKRGNYLFAKSIGGLKYDRANSVAIGTDNSLVITGHFAGKAIDFDPGKDTFYLYSSDSRAYQCFVAKYDSSGNFSSAFSIGNPDYDDDGKGVDIDSGNNIIVIGTYSTNDVDFDPGAGVYTLPTIHGETNFIAKYTALGAFVFADGIGNAYSRGINHSANINCVHADGKGNIYTGSGFSDSLDVDPGPKFQLVYEPEPSMLVSKFDASGKYLNSFNTGNYYDYYNRSSQLNASATDADGNIYTTGVFNGLLDFDPGPGVYALESKNDYRNSGYFAKYDKNGNLIFAKVIRGVNNGFFGSINDIAVDKSGAIYLCGLTSSHTDFDPSGKVQYWNNNKPPFIDSLGHFFAKYDRKGNLIFAKGFPVQYGSSLPEGIAVDENKNIYVAGNFGNTIDFDPGAGSHPITAFGKDIFLSKYDSLGNYVYAFNIGSGGGYDEATDVKINSAGTVIICGHLVGYKVDFDPGPGQFLLSSGTSYYQAGFVSEYNSDGSFINAFALRPNNNTGYDMYINTLLVDEATDNFYIAGMFSGKIDFAPGKDTSYLSSGSGMYFASYTSAGKLRFAKGSDMPVYAISRGGVSLNGLALDKQKNIYTAGSFSTAWIDLDFGPDSAILVNEHPDETNGFLTDLFLAKYDSLGNYTYGYDLDGDSAIGYNAATTIQVDNNNNIVLGGYGETKLDFDPGDDSLFLHPIALNGSTLFLVKYSPLTAKGRINNSDFSVADKKKISLKDSSYFSLYPNPAADYLFIGLQQIAESSGTASANIYDAKGAYVMKKQLGVINHAAKAVINVSSLSKGIYFITITTANGQYKAPFIVQ